MSILFSKDWVRYHNQFPDLGIHDNTKNMSFIKMSIVLKKMGIKNHLFHMALFDKELANYDPHAENLSPEIQLRIVL